MIKLRKPSKIVIALLAIIAVMSAVVLGQFIVTLQHNYSGGIKITGSVAAYQHGTTTTYTGFDFPLFEVTGEKIVTFDVKNLGNGPVIVQWSMNTSSLVWTVDGLGNYQYGSPVVFNLQLVENSTGTNLIPGVPLTAYPIAPGATRAFTLILDCNSVSLAISFTFKLDITAIA